MPADPTHPLNDDLFDPPRSIPTLRTPPIRRSVCACGNCQQGKYDMYEALASATRRSTLRRQKAFSDLSSRSASDL